MANSGKNTNSNLNKDKAGLPIDEGKSCYVGHGEVDINNEENKTVPAVAAANKAPSPLVVLPRLLLPLLHRKQLQLLLLEVSRLVRLVTQRWKRFSRRRKEINPLSE